MEDCDLQSCRQKWTWTASRQLMNVNDLEDPKCISTDQPADSSVLDLQKCSETTLRWECNDTLVQLKGDNLYLNYGNRGDKVNLFSYTGVWSRWVKYTTQDNICSDSRKGEEISQPC